MSETVTRFAEKLKSGLITFAAAAVALAALALMVWTILSGRIDARMYKTLAHDARTASAERVDPANENAIVHLSAAQPSSVAGVRDPGFGVAVRGFALRREVSMYQWFEQASGRGIKRRYEYYQDWCDCRNDSAKFHEPQGHENPPLPFENEVLLAPDARLGAFALTDPVLARETFADYDDADPPYPPEALVRLAADVKPLPSLSPEHTQQGWRVVADGEAYYRGADEEDPQVGDAAITYTQLASSLPISLVGVQHNGAIETYQRTPGHGHLIARIGAADAKSLIDEASGRALAAAGLLRAVGLVVLTLAFGVLGIRLPGLVASVPGVNRIGAHSRFGGGAVLGLLLGGALWLVALMD
ncbi:MAG: TMEM43 family protein [Arenimonas sp.]